MNTNQAMYETLKARAIRMRLLFLALLTLPVLAQAQAPIVLTQTPVIAGERDLSPPAMFEVIHPTTGAVLETRNFKYTTPSNFATRGAATVNLWVVFHGGGGNMSTMNRYFDIIPDSAPTAIIFPEATLSPNGDTQWRGVTVLNDVKDEDTFYDVAFIEQLVDNLLSANPQLHPNKVYASGFSSGANMTWTLLCYRSKPFRGCSMHSQPLGKAKRDSGCGDGRLQHPVSGLWTVKTGYEKLTGVQADRYGYNPNLPANKIVNKTKAVLYSHGTYDDNLEFTDIAGCSTANPATCEPKEDPVNSMDEGRPNQNRDDISTTNWLLERHDLANNLVATTPLLDEDPINRNDNVETTQRTYLTSLGTPVAISLKAVRWMEMQGGVHALSAFDHEGDDCPDYGAIPPSKSNCNTNLNASKDYETSIKVKVFFETYAGMLQ
jgi:poly(3-hydroxybutyrate) depolymerase